MSNYQSQYLYAHQLSNAIKAISLMGIALYILLLSGCSSPSIGSSIDDLTADFEYKGIFLKPKQVRISGINGLMPFEDVGKIVHYSPLRGSSTVITLSQDGVSKRLIQTINFDGSLQDLNEIKNKITDAELAAMQMVNAQIALTINRLSENPSKALPPTNVVLNEDGNVVSLTQPRTAAALAIVE